MYKYKASVPSFSPYDRDWNFDPDKNDIKEVLSIPIIRTNPKGIRSESILKSHLWKTSWPLVGNEGMNPQYSNVKVDSLIPY